jgi:hypothetical protein
MKYAGRTLAVLYAGIVLLAVLYAWTTEIQMRHQELEHLLPEIVLYFATLPLSLSLDLLHSAAPSFFDGPFVQVAFLTLCGAVQASLLWWWVGPQGARSARWQAAMCPSCSNRTLRRVQFIRATVLRDGQRAPDSWSYFLCSSCGVRLKQHLGAAFTTPTEEEWAQHCSNRSVSS